MEPAEVLQSAFPEHAARVLASGDPFVASTSGFSVPLGGDPAAALARRRGLSLELPRRADDAIRFHRLGAFQFGVRERGALGEGKVARGAVAYQRPGGVSFWSATEEGYEEWLLLERGVATGREPVATWEVEGATVREGDGTIEIADADGVAQVRVTAPVAFASGGRPVPTRLGLRDSRIELWADAGGEPVLVDPVWSAAGTMSAARHWPTAVVLASGKLLVAGGYTGTTFLKTAELYDPSAGTWTATGSMATGRYFHRAVLMADGRVLVAGGFGDTGPLLSTEIYAPSSGTWLPAGSLSSGRYLPTATLLGNGKVLVTGGYGTTGYLASTERFDPATSAWSAGPTLSDPRFAHTATWIGGSVNKVLVAGGYTGTSYLSTYQLYDQTNNTLGSALPMGATRAYHAAVALSGGGVLVTGGSNGTSAQATAQVYNTSTGWTSTASTMLGARQNHTATLLSSGKVLVAAGTSGASYLASAELYDPSTGSFTAAGTMLASRAYHSASLLGNDKVVLAGGYNGTSSLVTAEFFDPNADSWTYSSPLTVARWFHTASLLPDGRVWVAGGHNSTFLGLPSTQVYDPSTGVWTNTATMAFARERHTATVLQDGKVLIAGGSNNGAPITSAQVYDPATNTYVSGVGSMGVARQGHTATLLPDGRVLVAGGYSGVYLLNAEVYNPASKSWTPTDGMPGPRWGHAAVLLASGDVLVTGGYSGSVYLSTAATWNPTSTHWTGVVAPMNAARMSHTATLLPNGKVLVAGGAGGLASAELYTPGTSPTWTPIASMSTARGSHTATAIANGWVLVAGGIDTAIATASTQIYDPSAGTFGTWLPAAGLSAARYEHTATLLASGKVLVTGGLNLNSAETYTPVVIDDGNSCTTDAWTPALEQITHVNKASGVACPDDGNPCTSDVCDGAGQCVHAAVANGTGCGAALVCYGSGCLGGCYIGGTFYVSSAANPANACQVCTPATSTSAWSNRANGTACSDGNACTQTDSCQSGVCAGSNPVVCAAPDQCHDIGTCNPSTGVCSAQPPKANGIACNDGNACTQTDTCQSGACAGSNPVACAALDQCHDVGTCSPGTGQCSNPNKASGAACGSDGNACTSDVCDGAGTCSHPVLSNGTSCGSGVICNGGACLAKCFVGGVFYDPGTVNPANACQICTPSASTAAWSNRSNGLACNDSSACTSGDVCVNGACAGTPYTCTAGACEMTSTCDGHGGCTVVMKPAGGSCSDGDACNGLEVCDDAGQCLAGVPPEVDDGDLCTTDSCDPALGVKHASVAVTDNNPKTIDACNPQTGVVTHTACTLDPTVATRLAEAAQCYYVGPNALQTGVATNAFDPTRVAVVQGTVLARDGQGISGVKVTVVGHTESDSVSYGHVYTRIDGAFEIVVNGGGVVALRYEKAGYLRVDRQVQADWQHYIPAPSIVMIPLDPQVTTVTLDPAHLLTDYKVARGSTQQDLNDPRQATMLFPPGTTATMVVPDANGVLTDVPLVGTIDVRATEYTVGDAGPKAMPAALPLSSGYTYAVELGVDQARVAGAVEVAFNQFIPFYVDNFLAFPVGMTVPTGYYDARRQTWVPAENGRVIQVLANAQIDAVGGGGGDNATVLTQIGLDDGERLVLASLYAPGKTLWRARMKHFTPWDLNWPYAPPSGACGPLASCTNGGGGGGGGGDPEPGPQPPGSRSAAPVLDVAGLRPRLSAPGTGVLLAGSAGVFDDGERSWGAASWGFGDVPRACASGNLSERAARAGGGLHGRASA